MNKQELIEKIKKLPFVLLSERYISQNYVLELLEQLDEPEKVKVPQFVADWIEVCKEHLTHSLYTAMTPNFMKENGQSLDLILWIKKASNQDIFARAWIEGYTVEKEKRYCISMPKARNYKNHAQILCEENGKMFWCGEWYRFKTKFTRKELEEAGFGWVFDCEGIEIKEVK